MLDIKFIKENVEAVKKNIRDRNVSADVDLVVELYGKKSSLQFDMDRQRSLRNENAKKMKGKMEQEERQKLISEGKELKTKIAAIEEELKMLDKQFSAELGKIPNMSHTASPVGGEDDSVEIKKSGAIREIKFKPRDHVELGSDLDILDFETGARVAGQKFYYLKNEGALLEMALVQYGMRKLYEKGFTPYITPDLARESIVEGIGFNPRGEETNIYTVENTDLCLVGTAEITLGGIHMNSIINEGDLPLKMVGFSHCFRTEAGAAGKASRGLYRVHQFSKLEMFVLCKPAESEAMLEKLRELEEEIYTELGIPYRVLDIATGDLGAQAHKKYDLEAWMPGRGEYGEITSASNCTDYQARRLNIRYKDENGKNQYVHMLNGTAIAVSRVFISIIENYQNEDGSVTIPEVLVPFMGTDRITGKK